MVRLLAGKAWYSFGTCLVSSMPCLQESVSIACAVCFGLAQLCEGLSKATYLYAC
jgi:hypothetical protein